MAAKKTQAPNVDFNLDDMTIEELEIFEDIVGLSIDELQEKGSRKGKMLRAIAFIRARRTNPSVKLEDVGKLPITALAESGPLFLPVEQTG